MKVKSEREVAQSCPTLSDPMDCSLPGSPVPGIFQARVLEWGAIAFSLQNYKYKLTLEQRRGVMDNAGSGKSTYNYTISLPVVSNQLHILDQVVL